MGRSIVELEEAGEITDLRSLGIDARKMMEFNDKNELEELAEIIKQCMLQDYMLACSQTGDKYEEEAMATINR